MGDLDLEQMERVARTSPPDRWLLGPSGVLALVARVRAAEAERRESLLRWGAAEKARADALAERDAALAEVAVLREERDGARERWRGRAREVGDLRQEMGRLRGGLDATRAERDEARAEAERWATWAEFAGTHPCAVCGHPLGGHDGRGSVFVDGAGDVPCASAQRGRGEEAAHG